MGSGQLRVFMKSIKLPASISLHISVLRTTIETHNENLTHLFVFILWEAPFPHDCSGHIFSWLSPLNLSICSSFSNIFNHAVPYFPLGTCRAKAQLKFEKICGLIHWTSFQEQSHVRTTQCRQIYWRFVSSPQTDEEREREKETSLLLLINHNANFINVILTSTTTCRLESFQ